jgi:hypothetical protein
MSQRLVLISEPGEELAVVIGQGGLAKQVGPVA